jgi:RES domain-containing protein
VSSRAIWRVEKAVFAKTIRLGDGARLYGGRWNSPGRPAIYCAGSLSLALLEILAHVQTEEDAGQKRVLVRLELEESAIEEVKLPDLPKTWRSALNTSPCRKMGDAWLARASSVALKVPSAILPIESNYIVNPAHRDFAKVVKWGKLKPMQLDPRLLQNIEPTP